MCYKTTRWIEVKWHRPICSCRYVVLAQTAQPAAASRTDTQYVSMHAEVELQSELDWTSTLGGDMNRFSLLLLDLHPVDLLRHVPNKIRSANVSCSPALHVHTFVVVVFLFCFSRLPATDLCQRRLPGQCPALGLDCGAWAEHRPVQAQVQLRPTHDRFKQLRFKSDFFWNHVNAVILFIIVVVESSRGTFFSHWCLDAKQDAVKTKLHSKSR